MKSFLFEKLPYLLLGSFCLRWIAGALDGTYVTGFDGNFLKLLVLPAILVLYLLNIAANIFGGRLIFALPAIGNYNTRRLIRVFFVNVELILSLLLGIVFILNWFFLIPYLDSSPSDLRGLGAYLVDIYALLGITDIESAQNFSMSNFWGYFLVLLGVYAVFLCYRDYIKSGIRDNILKIYRQNAWTAIDLRANSENIEKGTSDLLSENLDYLKRSVSSGLLTKFLSKLVGSVYCSFLLVPDPKSPEENFVCISSLCSKVSWRQKITRIAKKHKPSVLNVEDLVNCWNNATREAGGFDRNKFHSEKEQYISSTGMAFAIEKPRIFPFVSNCLALCLAYRKYIPEIEGNGGELGRSLHFRSYCIVPIKANAKIIGAIFIGSTMPFSFNNEVLPSLEGFSHAIGHSLATLNEFGAIKALDGSSISIFETAKPYSQHNKRVKIKEVLRKINRMLRKGDMHAKPIST